MPLMAKAQEVIKTLKKKVSTATQSLLSRNKETSSSTTGSQNLPKDNQWSTKTEAFSQGGSKSPKL